MKPRFQVAFGLERRLPEKYSGLTKRLPENRQSGFQVAFMPQSA
ncbi:hypothetical protein [Eikenella halliae]|nr:hypothetical protein [Eikenella halliae]